MVIVLDKALAISVILCFVARMPKIEKNEKLSHTFSHFSYYGTVYVKGGNPKGVFCDDVSDMGKLSVKLILSHLN